METKSEIQLAKVDDLIEARIRFHLLEKADPSKVKATQEQGKSIIEAAVVMLSAALQAFFEDVFLESSIKCFGRPLNSEEMQKYRKTFERWGNPNADNVVRLFGRLAVADVFEGLNANLGGKGTNPRTMLDELNSARNCIAHGKPIAHRQKPMNLNLDKLRAWRTDAELLAKAFRFHAIHCCGLGAGS